MKNLRYVKKSKRFSVLTHAFIITLIISTTIDTVAAPGGKLIGTFIHNSYAGYALPLNKLSGRGRAIYSEFMESARQKEVRENYIFSSDNIANHNEVNFLLDLNTNLAQGLNVNYKTGAITRYALNVPKVKEAHTTKLIYDYNLNKTRVIQTYSNDMLGSIEANRLVDFVSIENKYYKRINHQYVYTNNMHNSVYAGFKDNSKIKITKDIGETVKFGFFWLPRNIEGELTQVYINETGTRFAFITTKGKIYKYIIENSPANTPADQGQLTFKQDLSEVDNTNFPEKGKQIPREKLNEMLYADVKITPGVKSAQESTASQIDMTPSTQATPGTVE